MQGYLKSADKECFNRGKEIREYEIEDIFRVYSILTHETGFYSYFSQKIRELHESGHEGTAHAYTSSLRSMQRHLGKKDFPFRKLSSRIITGYYKNYLLREYMKTLLFFTYTISRLFIGKVAGNGTGTTFPIL